MARNKPEPKALFPLKHDFYASLDRLTQEAIMLLQAVDFAVKHGGMTGPAKGALEERAAAFRAALSSGE